MKTILCVVFLVSSGIMAVAQSADSTSVKPKICACESDNFMIQYEWNVGPGEGCLSGKAFNAFKETFVDGGRPGVRRLANRVAMDPKEVQRICEERSAAHRKPVQAKKTDPQKND